MCLYTLLAYLYFFAHLVENWLRYYIFAKLNTTIIVVVAFLITANGYLEYKSAINQVNLHGAHSGLFIPLKKWLRSLPLIRILYVKPLLRKFRTSRYHIYAINIIDLQIFPGNVPLFWSFRIFWNENNYPYAFLFSNMRLKKLSHTENCVFMILLYYYL